MFTHNLGFHIAGSTFMIPIGSYNPEYGVTLSMPSVLRRSGVVQILEPDLSAEEQQGLEHSAEILRSAVARIGDVGAHV
jgi:L-lactate dehydrogenase